jgi:hypothetical protein
MTSRIGRISLLVAVVTLASFIGVAPANATSLPVTVTPPTAGPRDHFVVSGPADCIQGSTLTITIAGLLLTDSVSGDNAWELTFTVPDTVAIGSYPIVVTGQECNFSIASIEVVASTTTTAAPTTAAPTTLAPTTTAPAAKAAAVAATPAFTG